MIVTEETKRVAQGVVDYIVEHPERHDQELWFTGGGDIVGPRLFGGIVTEEDVCGSTMCIAGTAVYLSGGAKALERCLYSGGDFEEDAAELLGLDAPEANDLFYTMDNGLAFDAVSAIAAGDQNKFEEILGIQNWPVEVDTESPDMVV